MGHDLEHAVLQCVNARHLLFLIESIRATDRAGREHGGERLCSPAEEEFVAETERHLRAGRPIDDDGVAKLRTLFERAGHAPYPVLGSVRWLGEAVRLVDSVSASLKEFYAPINAP